MIHSIKQFLYSSKNMDLFYVNFTFWFLLKCGLSFYYGMNLNSILCGFLSWSFWEYTYHRVAMHGLKHTEFYYKMHGYHHVYPNKPSHIPIFQYMMVSPIFFIAAYYVNPSYVFSYSVGHLGGLYCFEKMHCYIHNDKLCEQMFSKYHMYHHSHSTQAFCFTSPCFDILFGTFPYNKFSYNVLGMLPIPYVSFYGIFEVDTSGTNATIPTTINKEKIQ